MLGASPLSLLPMALEQSGAAPTSSLSIALSFLFVRGVLVPFLFSPPLEIADFRFVGGNERLMGQFLSLT